MNLHWFSPWTNLNILQKPSKENIVSLSLVEFPSFSAHALHTGLPMVNQELIVELPDLNLKLLCVPQLCSFHCDISNIYRYISGHFKCPVTYSLSRHAEKTRLKQGWSLLFTWNKLRVRSTVILKPNQTIARQQATVTNVNLHPCLMSLSVHSFSVIPSSIICLQKIVVYLWIHSFIRLLALKPRDIGWLYLANTRDIHEVASFFIVLKRSASTTWYFMTLFLISYCKTTGNSLDSEKHQVNKSAIK